MVQSSMVRIIIAILCVLGLIPMAFFIWMGGWRMLLTLTLVIGIIYLVLKNFNLEGTDNSNWSGIGDLRDFLWRLKPLARKTIYFLILFFVIWLLGAIVGYQYYKKSNTANECEAIVTSLNEYFSKNGKYPDHLQEIISNNPLRRDWSTDQWNNPYRYVVKNDGKDFLLVSAGKDKEFNTSDDLIFGKK